MDTNDLLVAVTGPVMLLSLNRPHSLNALTPLVLERLSAALDDAQHNPSVKTVVLTGSGRAFCSGADLGVGGAHDLGDVLIEHYNPVLLKLRALDKPVIAAVNGVAAGAGASLALMADLVVMGRSATFAQAFVNVGLIPDAGATWLLPRHVGLQRAMGLAMLGVSLAADEALKLGMAWSVVDDSAVLAEAMALATRLAGGPAIALAHIKRAMHSGMERTLDEQLALEAEYQGRCGKTLDFAEGVHAFIEKRHPVFSGQ